MINLLSLTLQVLYILSLCFVLLEFSPLREGSCRTVKLKALQQGHTKVIATYDHGGISLQSSVTIATYDKLIVSVMYCMHYTKYMYNNDPKFSDR